MTAGPIIVAELSKSARERVRVTLHTFRGTRLLDVRVYFDLGQGSAPRPTEFCPTGKGVAIRAELISELAAAIREAEAEARRLGWIEGTR